MSSDGASRRRFVEKDSRDHLPVELEQAGGQERPDRKSNEGSQHAENLSPVRGLSGDGQDQGEQAPEEASPLPG